MDATILGQIVDALEVGGIGLLLWKGGRWTKGIEKKIDFLCSRVRRLEATLDADADPAGD